MSDPVKKVVAQILYDLKIRPMDFACDQYTLKDQATNTEYWISNGSSSSGVYWPHVLDFGFFQGRKFWKGFKQWQAFIIISRSEVINSSVESTNITPKPKQLTSSSSTQKD